MQNDIWLFSPEIFIEISEFKRENFNHFYLKGSQLHSSPTSYCNTFFITTCVHSKINYLLISNDILSMIWNVYTFLRAYIDYHFKHRHRNIQKNGTTLVWITF